jgi:hypothetical protein
MEHYLALEHGIIQEVEARYFLDDVNAVPEPKTVLCCISL